MAPKQITEHPSQVRNIRLRIKLQTAAIREVLAELGWASLAQRRNGYELLLFQDELVFLCCTLGFESLPWQFTFQEIH